MTIILPPTSRKVPRQAPRRRRTVEEQFDDDTAKLDRDKAKMGLEGQRVGPTGGAFPRLGAQPPAQPAPAAGQRQSAPQPQATGGFSATAALAGMEGVGTRTAQSTPKQEADAGGGLSPTGRPPAETSPMVSRMDARTPTAFPQGGLPPPTVNIGQQVDTAQLTDDLVQDQKSISDLQEEAIRALLETEIDTSEEEALLRELTEERASQDRLDARAGLGAAGFGSTAGGLGFLADISDRAGREAAQGVADIRRDARLEQRGAVLEGIEGAFRGEEAEAEAQDRNVALAILAEEMGISPGQLEQIMNPEGVTGEGNSALPMDMTGEQLAAVSMDGGLDWDNVQPIDPSAVPEGWKFVGTSTNTIGGATFTHRWYRGPNGEIGTSQSVEQG
jgi:hypothetical protein